VKLSGGQKQRVAIARTILKDPKILLLDEATSSLDAGSEKVVQDAINNLMQDRTAIIVAHRLATIRDVDKIYVLEDGQVAESGSHDELIQKDQGIYKNLANLQFNLKAS
jgi:ABC-type multidrug transport system fused ATPase/permease subunit